MLENGADKDSYGRQDTSSVTFVLPATNSYIYDLNGKLSRECMRLVTLRARALTSHCRP